MYVDIVLGLHPCHTDRHYAKTRGDVQTLDKAQLPTPDPRFQGPGVQVIIWALGPFLPHKLSIILEFCQLRYLHLVRATLSQKT